MSRWYDDYGSDDRQESEEEAYAEALYARSVFQCWGCGEQFDIMESVVFRSVPEEPEYCLNCASGTTIGRY